MVKENPSAERPSWDDYFMQIVHIVKTRSTCIRRQVGCVIVKDKKILATGYNGAPSGLSHCLERGCMRQKLNIPSGERHELCRALHAEQNAIIQAAISGVTIADSKIFCSHHPCSLCAKMLINSRIKEIYYSEGYPDSLAEEMLEEAGIKRIKTDSNSNKNS